MVFAGELPGDGSADDAAAGDDDVEVGWHGGLLSGPAVRFECGEVTRDDLALRQDLWGGSHFFDGFFAFL